MLLNIFSFIVSMLVFAGATSALVGYEFYRRRINVKDVKTLEWSLKHQVFVVGAVGILLALVFVLLSSMVVHFMAKNRLLSTPGMTVIAERIGIPSDESTVDSWTTEQVCTAYNSNDELALSTRRQILNNLVIGNESKFSVSDENRMVKVIANSARLKGLEATPGNFVAMLEYASSDGICLEGEGDASCREQNTTCLDEIGSGANGPIEQYLVDRIVPPIFSASLFGADNLPPKPRQIRYQMFEEFDGDPQSVVGRFSTNLQNDPALSNTAIPVMEAYINVMIEMVSEERRLRALFWGPIQLITMALFFGALILASERIWLIRDLDRGLDAYLKNRKKAGATLDKLRIEFQEVVYSPINFIIWALPTLGFIGTVMGISAAIADAYKVAENIGPVAQGEAIKGVTSLLGIAFDTTFIALVCSLPLMAIIAAIRARETRAMNAIF